MIYLDYSATTKADAEVIEAFEKTSQNFFANPNSHHKLGLEAKKLIDKATEQTAKLLGVKSSEIIYTSGASEANNLAIKSIAEKYQGRGKHIITSELEHPSVYAPLNYLTSKDYDVDIIACDESGNIDMAELEACLRDDTILLSLTAVSSETGVILDIEKVVKLLKKYPKCFLHLDITQAVGKIDIDLSDVDLASFSAHKFFGIKGIGALYKKEKILINPQIHGGGSTTIFRSGTPSTALIVSLSKALRLIKEKEKSNFSYVKNLNDRIRRELSNYEFIKINSPESASPYILNLSFMHAKPETVLHMYEEAEVYISTQTACSSKDTYSRAVYAISKDKEAAEHSIRISLSSKTTNEEIDEFLKLTKEIYNKIEVLYENN